MEEKFSKRECVIFYKNKEGKIISRLPNGKYIFPDRHEKLDSIQLGVPYDCAVYELEHVAFAKLLSPTRLPLIITNIDSHPNQILIIEDVNGAPTHTFIDQSKLSEYLSLHDMVLVKNRGRVDD